MIETLKYAIQADIRYVRRYPVSAIREFTIWLGLHIGYSFIVFFTVIGLCIVILHSGYFDVNVTGMKELDINALILLSAYYAKMYFFIRPFFTLYIKILRL